MHPHPDRNVRLLYGFWFLRDFQLWIPVWIVFLTQQQHFSLTDVTTAEGLYLVGVVVLEVPTGAVADHWGRSRSMALGAVCLGVAVLIFAFTTSFAILMTSFMLWSVAHSLMSGSDTALLFDTLKASGREAHYERLLGRGTAFTWAGAGIATFLGGPVAALLSIRATIFIGAATCLVTALVALLLWEPPRAARAHGERYVRSIRMAFAEVWAHPELRATILLAGTTGAAIEAVQYLVQPYLLDRGVEVGVTFSLLQVPMILAGIVGALGAATLQRRRGESGPLRLLPLVGVAAFAGLTLAPGLAAYAAIPLLFALSACLVPIATGYINRRVESGRRATVLSMLGMVTSLTAAAVAPGLGFIADHWGLTQAFAAGGAVTLGAVLLFGLAPRPERQPEAAEGFAGR